MTKKEREIMEHRSLFSDSRYAKKAWRQFIEKSLQSDVAILPDFEDNQGKVTPQSEIYRHARIAVANRLKAENIDRPPMKAEVLIEAAVIRAAFDNSALNIVLDRTAGKVKEELNIGVNQYEDLSDEELEILAAHRAKALAAPEDE